MKRLLQSVRLLLLVPAAFVVGWRLGRTVGRLARY